MAASTAAAFASLLATLRQVDGLRVLPDAGQAVDPPALVVPPPTITLDVYSGHPNEWSFQVALVVGADDRAIERLLVFADAVAAVVHASPDAAITANPAPGSFGNPPLPAYLITIEVT